MEISRDALMRVVSATRMSISMAEDMRKLQADPTNRSMADVITGLLTDSLLTFVGEKLDSGQDLWRDSKTIKILTCDLARDEEATQMLLAEYRYNHPQQPKPHFPDREEMKKQAAAGFGYMAPEVDRT